MLRIELQNITNEGTDAQPNLLPARSAAPSTR